MCYEQLQWMKFSCVDKKDVENESSCSVVRMHMFTHHLVSACVRSHLLVTTAQRRPDSSRKSRVKSCLVTHVALWAGLVAAHVRGHGKHIGRNRLCVVRAVAKIPVIGTLRERGVSFCHQHSHSYSQIATLW
jgi:hypothetical protein